MEGTQVNEINFLFVPTKEVKREWTGNKKRRRGTKKERMVSSYYESKGYSLVRKTRKRLEIPEKFKNKKLESALSDRIGLPDLLALDTEEPTKFIEVKGPSQWLSNDQIDWIITHAGSFPIEVVLTGKFEGTVKFSSSFRGNLAGYLGRDIEELIKKKRQLTEEVKELRELLNEMGEKRKKLELHGDINMAIDRLKAIKSELDD